MKLKITIHMVYSGYAWRVHFNNEYLIGGLLIRGWSLKQVVSLSYKLLQPSNDLNMGHNNEQSTTPKDSGKV